MNTYDPSHDNEIARIEAERKAFLWIMQDPDWKSPRIDSFGTRVVDIAKPRVRKPIDFCEYLHFGVHKVDLDPSWAKVASAIQFSLGATAEKQISARYSVLLNFPKAPIFLCHASEDKVAVRRYAAMLHHVGYSPWIDESSLVPGQDWDAEIRRTIKECFAFVVFISPRSHKQGYVQSEIDHALDEAERQHHGRIFLIPAKLEACDPPERLAHLHWVNLYIEEGFSQLCQALRVKEKQKLV